MIQAPLRYYRHLRGKQAFEKAEALAAQGKAAEAAEAFDLAAALSGDDLALRRDAVEAAADLYQSLGRASETAARAEQLADLAPDEPEVILRLARARDIIGRREDAAAAWTRRLELATDCDQAPRRLADLLSGAAAIPHLRTLAYRAPEELAPWIRLGDALSAEGDFAGAAEAWRRRLAFAPDCDEAPRRLADLLRGAEALPHIRTLARRAPDDAEAWERLALALDAEADPAGAAEAWSHLAGLRPDDLSVRRRAIALLLGLNRQAEAAAHLETAATLDPADASLWKALALACRALGDSEGELRAWLGAARAKPEKVSFRVEIVRLLTAAGRAEEAAAHTLALARLKGDDVVTWRRAARALAALGNEAAAADAWTQLLAIDGADLEAHRALAAFHRAGQRPAEALPHLRFEADTIGGAGVIKRVALTLDLLGDPVEAEVFWRRLLDLSPAHAEGVARVVAQARARGEPAKALDVVRTAMAADPDDQSRVGLLVDLLIEAGDAAAAIVELHRAADADPAALTRIAELAPRLQGEAEGLRTLLQRALKTRPDDVSLLRLLARNLAAVGDADGAFDLWSRLLAQAPDDVGAARAVGTYLYDAGRRADAAPALAVAAAAAPRELRAWRRLAWARRGEENVEGEIAALRHLLAELTPDDDETKLRLIELLSEADRRGEAEPLLAEMADKRPNDIRLRTGLARARRDLGDEAGALAAWRQVLEINPGEPDANHAIGEALEQAGDLRAAADHLAAAAPAAGKAGKAWARVVRLRREAKDDVGEIAALQGQILAAVSTDLSVHQRLVQLLEAAGRTTEGEASLARIARDRPDDAKTLRRLARVRDELGRPDEAAEAWTRLLGLIPDDTEAQLALARHRLDLGEPVLAAAFLEAAGAAAPGDLWARAAQGFAAEEDVSAEIAAWRAAVAREPRLAEAHARLAELLIAVGEGAAAAPHLAFSVEQTPDDHRLRKRYALTLRAAGRLGEAAEQFGVVARQRPTRRRPWRRYARALTEAGDLQAAVDAWRHVLAVGGDEREARENLGLLLQRLGRFDEAAGYLQGHRGRAARRLRRLDEATARLGGLHQAFAQADLTILDVGARGGPLAWTTLLAPYAQYVACEPEPAEAARLAEAIAKAHPWRQVRVVPEGLGRQAGSAHLKLTEHSGFSSVLPPSEAMAARFGLSTEMTVTGEVEIPVTTLAEAAARHGFEELGLLKIDTQGSELDILKGGEALLKGPVQAVFVEVEFREFYKGQPLFGDVDRHLRGLGFELLRLEPVSRRRVRPGRKLSYSRHEVVWAHALFVKRAPEAAALPSEVFLKRTLQQIAIAMAYELFDLAAELAEAGEAQAAFTAAGLKVEVADIEAFAASGVAERLARDFAKAWPDQIKGVPKAYTG
jgi:FkbM family methyltransferase